MHGWSRGWMVCDYTVTLPKQVEEIYGKLQPAQKDAIEVRDSG